MNFKELSNNDLIKHIAEEPGKELAWNDFYRRVDEHIRLVIMRQCRLKHLNIQEHVDDLAQKVYFKLLEDNCKALRTFRGENENAIYAFLAVTAQRMVYNHWRAENAIKRWHIKVPLEGPASSGSLADERLRPIDILVNPYAPAPDEKLMIESSRQEVEMILDEIMTGNEKERDKKIFLDHIYEELTAQEISERVPLSTKRIRHIIGDIRKRLKASQQDGKKI